MAFTGVYGSPSAPSIPLLLLLSVIEKMLDPLTAADFTPHLQSRFIVPLNAEESTTLILIQVKERSPELAPPGSGRVSFALQFHGNHLKGFLPQQTWRLEHDILGALDIFLVPIGRNANGMTYEAIFN